MDPVRLAVILQPETLKPRSLTREHVTGIDHNHGQGSEEDQGITAYVCIKSSYITPLL